jgi:hypothetical protein
MTLGKRTDYGDAKYAGLEVALPQDVDTAVQVYWPDGGSSADRVTAGGCVASSADAEDTATMAYRSLAATTRQI